MQLLEAMRSGNKAGAQAAASLPPAASSSPRPARWFRVRVTDMDTERVRVNIRMPIHVVTTGFKLGARFSPEVDGMDMTQLMEAIRAGETGQVVDIIDKKGGDHVEVFLE